MSASLSQETSVVTFPYWPYSICGVSIVDPVASYEAPHADGDYCNTRFDVAKQQST
jgi:hypothetical protein